MSAGDRAEKLYVGLTAQERGVMRLHYFKEDAEEPKALETSTPPEQIAEVNRLTGLFNEAHREVTRHALWLGARLEAVSVRMGMLHLIHLWALKDERLRDAFGLRGAARRRAQEKNPAPAWPPSAGPEGSLGRELLEVVEQGLNAAWSELLAVEAVLTETAQAFDGEDPIHPEARVLLEEVKSFALGLAKDVAAMRPDYRLPEEPAAAVVRLLGELVRRDD